MIMEVVNTTSYLVKIVVVLDIYSSVLKVTNKNGYYINFKNR